MKLLDRMTDYSVRLFVKEHIKPNVNIMMKYDTEDVKFNCA